MLVDDLRAELSAARSSGDKAAEVVVLARLAELRRTTETREGSARG